MAFDFIPHLKIAGLAAPPEWLAKRSKAVRQLAAAFRKKKGDDGLLVAATIVGLLTRGFQAMPDTVRTEVFNAVRKAAPQWIPDKHGDAELGLCAILAAIVVVTDAAASDYPDVTAFALALLSGAQFLTKGHNAQLEKLRRAIVQQFGDALHDRAETVRHRNQAPVPTIPGPKPEEPVAAHIARALPVIQNGLNGLQLNALRDREELDLLWWRLNGVGTIIRGRFGQMAPANAAVCAGLEVGSLLTLAIASDAHRHIAASVLVAPDEQLSLLDILKSLSEHIDRVRVAYAAGSATVSGFPTLFPLLYGLQVAGDDTETAALATARIDAATLRSAEEWSCRAVDEATLLYRLGYKTKLPAPVRA